MPDLLEAPVAGPVVVDSPAPVVGNPLSATPPTQQTTVEQKTTEVKPDELTALAESVGLPADALTTFKDSATAKAALKSYLQSEQETGARYGREPVTPPKPAAPVQQAPVQGGIAPLAESTLDLASLGLEEDEPAAKALRAMEAQLKAIGSKYDTLHEEVQAYTNQSQAADEQTALNEAFATIDSWASPAFGTSQVRTVLQESALEKLAQVAGDLARSERSKNKPVSPVSVRLNRARFILETGAETPAAPAPAPRGALNERQSSGMDTEGLGTVGLLGSWSRHPAYRAAQKR